MSEPILVVNADDYGLTAQVSRGILRAHKEGILTSTSVLALGSGFRESAAWLTECDTIGVGVHLALVGEDPPLLGATEIPTLVDRRGNLAFSWRRLLPRVAAGRVDPDDVRRELSAQIEAVRSIGVPVDHLNSHQHVHMFPGIREVVVDLAVHYAVPVVRVTRSAQRGPVGRFVRRLARQLEAELRADGLAFTATAAGLDEAGRCDEARMIAAVARLARHGASAELSTHPGEADDPPRARYRWNYHWARELDALCSPAVRTAVGTHGWRLARFADLAPARAGQSGGSR